MSRNLQNNCDPIETTQTLQSGQNDPTKGRRNTPLIPPLFEHQKETIDFHNTHDSVLDLSDAGTAKTRSVLEAYSLQKQTNPNLRLLVVCPKSIMLSAWDEDRRKYTHHLSLRIAIAPSRKRAAAFESKSDIVVLNQDGIKWLAENAGVLIKDDWIACIDEFTAFKNINAARTKALISVRDLFKQRILLSGTPMPKTVLDIFTPTLFADGGTRLGKSYYRFRSQVCRPMMIHNRVQWEDKAGAEESVANMLSDISIRYKLEECHDMPEHINRTMYVDMHPDQREMYKELKAEGLLLFDTDQVVSAVNAGVVVQKALQLLSGSIYDQNGQTVPVHTDRYDLVMQLIKERDHSLVACMWKHQMAMFEQLSEKANLDYAMILPHHTPEQRSDIVTKYQDGHYQVLFANPASTAHGLTLTRGKTVIWASPTYNAEHYLQFNRRIYRAGQKHRTEVINVACNDSIEQDVYENNLAEKQARMDNFLNLMVNT